MVKNSKLKSSSSVRPKCNSIVVENVNHSPSHLLPIAHFRSPGYHPWYCSRARIVAKVVNNRYPLRNFAPSLLPGLLVAVEPFNKVILSVLSCCPVLFALNQDSARSTQSSRVFLSTPGLLSGAEYVVALRHRKSTSSVRGCCSSSIPPALIYLRFIA